MPNHILIQNKTIPVGSQPSYEILVTALPNGETEDWLSLSVIFSPRLKSTPDSNVELPLSYYASTFLTDWPKIMQMKFQVLFGPSPETPGNQLLFDAIPEWEFRSSSQRKPDFDGGLWEELIDQNRDRVVRPYQFDPGNYTDAGQHPVLSYSESKMFNRVKEKLYSLAAEYRTTPPQRAVVIERMQKMQFIVEDETSSGTKQYKLPFDRATKELQKIRKTPPSPSSKLHQEQSLYPKRVPERSESKILKTAARSFIKGRSYSDVYESTGLSEAATDLLRYKTMHETEDRSMPLPPPPTPPVIDFHRLLSSFGDYPELMRRIGLRVDLRVKIDAPKLAYKQGVVCVRPVAPAEMANRFLCIKTRYSLEGGFASQATSEEIQNRMLAFGRVVPEEGRLYDVLPGDVEGAISRIDNFAQCLIKPLHTDEVDEVCIPPLRSAGLSVAHNDRHLALQDLFEKMREFAGERQPEKIVASAEHLVRGFRIDVREIISTPGSPVRFGTWRSLCMRRGEYRMGKKVGPDTSSKPLFVHEDEGWIALGIATTPQGGKKDVLMVYESLFRWAGWSLCVPRPGKDITLQAGKDDTSQGQVAYGGQQRDRDDPLQVKFSAVPGTLPRLRFGRHYQFRARVVDLAGNSLPVTADLALKDLVTDEHDGYYDRFDPVSSPLVLLTQPTTGPNEKPLLPGESAARLVIRSINLETSDSVAANISTPTSTRHLVPPKVSQELAEAHGMFDDAQTRKLQGIKAFRLMANKDSSLNEIHPEQKLTVPYLPDPLAAGVALLGLPGTGGANVLVHHTFEGDWPDLQSLRLQLHEGSGPPVFKNNMLRVFLPKGDQTRVQLSCFLPDDSERFLGIWRWITEEFLAHPRSDISLDAIRALVQQGRHWMITPPRELVFVHAVQQPVFNPQWASLAVGHKGMPSVATNHIRKAGDLHAYLYGTIALHRASTGKLDLMATWTEPMDDADDDQPLTATPRRITGSGEAFEVSINLDGPPHFDATPRSEPPPPATSVSQALKQVPTPDPVASAQPNLNIIKESSKVHLESPSPKAPPPYDESKHRCAPPVPPLPPELQAHVCTFIGKHLFPDTKYRCVTYRAVASTRYREYFLPMPEEETRLPVKDRPKWTRDSSEIKVDILNSAQPAPPKILYVLPTFKWEKSTHGSRRVGGGLRVYMDRPWYSSGDGEQLAAVLYPEVTADLPEYAKPHVCEWGLDPLWQAGSSPSASSGQSKTSLDLRKTYKFLDAKTEQRQIEPQDFLERKDRLRPQIEPLKREQGKAVAKEKIDAKIAHMFGVGLSHPAPHHFRNSVAVRHDLHVNEVLLTLGKQVTPEPMPVIICAFEVKPDTTQNLWYCDIEMDPGQAYFPFVRLALARYQPNSVRGAHLSTVVLADFCQLVPERSVSLVPDPKNANAVLVSVKGPGQNAGSARSTRMEAIIEEADRAEVAGGPLPSGLDWIPLVDSKRDLHSMDASQWSGSITLPPAAPGKHYRVIVREFEVFSESMEDGLPRKKQERLVYADVLGIAR